MIRLYAILATVVLAIGIGALGGMVGLGVEVKGLLIFV